MILIHRTNTGTARDAVSKYVSLAMRASIWKLDTSNKVEGLEYSMGHLPYSNPTRHSFVVLR